MSNYLGHHVATGGPSKVHQVLQKKLLQGFAKARGLTALVFKTLLSDDSHIDRGTNHCQQHKFSWNPFPTQVHTAETYICLVLIHHTAVVLGILVPLCLCHCQFLANLALVQNMQEEQAGQHTRVAHKIKSIKDFVHLQLHICRKMTARGACYHSNIGHHCHLCCLCQVRKTKDLSIICTSTGAL